MRIFLLHFMRPNRYSVTSGPLRLRLKRSSVNVCLTLQNSNRQPKAAKPIATDKSDHLEAIHLLQTVSCDHQAAIDCNCLQLPEISSKLRLFAISSNRLYQASKPGQSSLASNLASNLWPANSGQLQTVNRLSFCHLKWTALSWI